MDRELTEKEEIALQNEMPSMDELKLANETLKRMFKLLGGKEND